jgi:hypothetical protein
MVDAHITNKTHVVVGGRPKTSPALARGSGLVREVRVGVGSPVLGGEDQLRVGREAGRSSRKKTRLPSIEIETHR